ncbi:MAG: GHKL domain-containing protein [Peptococcaceae bacterium]|nr:GHKL domain-containing protein [Peptococcaceae bacterium]
MLIPLMFYIVSLNYESSVRKRLVATVYYFVLFMLIVGFTFSFNDSLFASLPVYAKDNLIDMAASLVFYLVAHLLRRFKNIRKRDLPMPWFWVFALAVPCLTVSIFIFSVLDFQVMAMISFCFFIIGANFLVFFLYNILSATYENKLKSVLHSQEKEYYLSQCQLMQESLEKMKSSRHDMKTYLTTIKNYAEGNKRAAEYLDSLLGNIEESEVYSDTGNIAFDSIINFKLKNAKADNIKPEIAICVPSELNIEVADIVTIIGSLLDNALDAVAKVEEKVIKLNINFNEGKLFIKMENTFDGEVKYTDDHKSGEGKCIATRKDGDRHGCGLKNIRKSVEKYKGCVDITHTDTVFSVELLL